MRTTLNIDDDVLDLARGLAEARQVSIGKAFSDLARRGTQARSPGVSKSGFFTFNVEGGQPLLAGGCAGGLGRRRRGTRV